MKHLAKTIITICLFLFSGNAFGQELLGKTYDEVIKSLKENNSKYETEKLDNGVIEITEYSKWDKNRESSQLYFFHQKGKQLVCFQIIIVDPESYYGSFLWDIVKLRLEEGYEKTNYLFFNPFEKYRNVYKSKSWSKNEHYMSMDFMDNTVEMIYYFLNTSNFETKK